MSWQNKSGRYPQGRRPWDNKPRGQQSAVSQVPAPPFGTLVETVRPDDLESEAKKLGDTAVAVGVKTVASYNWLNKKKPTIMIPGKPPRWTPPAVPGGLREDSGTYFRDINSAYHAKHPMEPAVVAALETDPKLPREVDIVACGSTLGNLLRFIRGEDKPFRMLVEDVHGTVFLVRRENSPTEVLRDVRGYGHSFPEAYTTWDPEVQGSVSHQRLVHYRFGGFGMLVRFEGDGYIAKGAKSDAPSDVKRDADEKTRESADQLALALSLAMTSVSHNGPAPAANVQVSRGGQLIDQSLVFDLKTRAAWKKMEEDTLAGEMQRLWIAQIPTFVMAYHERGVFRDIEVVPVGARVAKWEKEHNGHLSRLAALLHRITTKLRDRPDGKIELCQRVVGVLEVREQLAGAGNALSPAVGLLWEKGLGKEDVQSEDEKAGNSGALVSWEDGADDYTACSTECGYCGGCTY